MKVRATVNCVGLGYNLKVGDKANLKKDLAKKLIDFEYVEEIKEPEQVNEDDTNTTGN